MSSVVGAIKTLGQTLYDAVADTKVDPITTSVGGPVIETQSLVAHTESTAELKPVVQTTATSKSVDTSSTEPFQLHDDVLKWYKSYNIKSLGTNPDVWVGRAQLAASVASILVSTHRSAPPKILDMYLKNIISTKTQIGLAYSVLQLLPKDLRDTADLDIANTVYLLVNLLTKYRPAIELYRFVETLFGDRINDIHTVVRDYVMELTIFCDSVEKPGPVFKSLIKNKSKRVFVEEVTCLNNKAQGTAKTITEARQEAAKKWKQLYSKQ